MKVVWSDLLPVLYLLPLLAAALGAGLYAEWRHGHAVSGLLTRREWRFALKLAGIAFLAAILVLGKIALDFPAEKFLYGRF